MSDVAVDPWSSPEVVADPYPFYKRLRDAGPCQYLPDVDVYVISRYDDVVQTLRSPETFRSGEGVGYPPGSFGSLVDSDPPHHTELRRAVSRFFLPRAMAALATGVTEMADRLLDQAIGAGAVDFMGAVVEPLTISVIAELLGVPHERRDDFKRWSDGGFDYLGGAMDPAVLEPMAAAITEGLAYFAAVVEERRKAPGPRGDIIDALLSPLPDGERLSDEEVEIVCLSLLAAANETSRGLVGNGVLALVQHPQEWNKLAEGPDLVPAAVEEMLRFDAPIQAFFRRTAAETEVGPVRIPAGARVMVAFGSANRDERHFPDPDEFRVGRNPADHLAFGAGIHRCVGAPLARLEATALFTKLRQRVRAVVPAGDVVRQVNPVLRGVSRLPVVLTAA